MESLRDQLATLFPELGREKKGKPSLSLTKDAQPKITTVSTPEQIDWKKGVTPLPASGRRESTEGVARKQAAVPERKRFQSAAKPNFNKPPAAVPRVAAPVATTTAPVVTHGVASPAPVRPNNVQPQPAKNLFGNLQPPVLAREGEFKAPEPWVDAGAELQPPTGGNGRVMPVRVGIDFGTAYTKVAIRAGDQIFFVPWSGVRNHAAMHYLPGEVSVSPDGAVWLGRMNGAIEVRNDLKLPFLERNISSREQFGAAIAYLAWVMRYARAWLYQTQPALVQGRRLAWEVNLGCPTDSWAARDIRFSYETLGVFAWQLSQTSRDLGWEYAVSMAKAGRPSAESVGLDAIHLMPEFVAQIAGYVRSPQRRNRLHLLMDVGAGTVDLATFNIGPDQDAEGDRYSIFVSKVLPLGTHYLMAERNKGSGGASEWDDFQAVPDAEQFSTVAGIPHERVIASDREFEQCVTREIAQLLNHTHVNRYGKAPEWATGLPTFLSGGGSDCEVYANSVDLAFQQQKVPLRSTPFPLLEEAAKLEGVGVKDFHRLSVAYGLTFDAESVGRILAPHEIEDAPRIDPNVDKPRPQPDHEDMYTK